MSSIPTPALSRFYAMTGTLICPEDQRGQGGQYDFYLDRLYSAMHYGERSGSEIIKTVCRCAFNDDVLTEGECISIINMCHSPQWYIIWKEIDYNEGWN